MDGYLQRSYLSEYNRYRRHEFITISIEGSISRPEPAPPSREPQPPKPPLKTMQNIVAPEVPTQGNSKQLDTLSLFYCAFLQLFVHFRVIMRLLLLRRLFSSWSPFICFGIYLFCTYSLYLQPDFTPFSSLSQAVFPLSSHLFLAFFRNGMFWYLLSHGRCVARMLSRARCFVICCLMADVYHAYFPAWNGLLFVPHGCCLVCLFLRRLARILYGMRCFVTCSPVTDA